MGQSDKRRRYKNNGESMSDDDLYTELKLTAVEDTTFSFSKNCLSYSLDEGDTWTVLQGGVPTPTIAAGNSVLFLATSANIINSSTGMGTFSSTGLFDVSGDIMSLVTPQFRKPTSISYHAIQNYNFFALFKAAKVRNARRLNISRMYELKTYCFAQMFQNCSYLLTAPDLPVLPCSNSCYQNMFQGCTGLTSAPNIPLVTLANYCFCYMFAGCTGLTSAPDLLNENLAVSCYQSMFQGCTGLTSAPSLPATTMKTNCYQSMFNGSTSLTKAPVLPATTLVTNCYKYMFYKCSNLSYIKAMFTTEPSSSYTDGWVQQVAASGIFIKNSAATWNVTGNNGIPSGWTVQTAAS